MCILHFPSHVQGTQVALSIGGIFINILMAHEQPHTLYVTSFTCQHQCRFSFLLFTENEEGGGREEEEGGEGREERKRERERE